MTVATLIQPARIAAIDAGSNAIRLIVGRAVSASRIRTVDRQRWAVRLGHGAFTDRWIDEETQEKAVDAFRHFARLFEKLRVEEYRAVATSALREARNRREVVSRIEAETGIRLEVISDEEEGRLILSAVKNALPPEAAPLSLVMDLGGGSLDITLMRSGRPFHSTSLPIGTVRIWESLSLGESLGKRDIEKIRAWITPLLHRHLPHRLAGMWRQGSVVLCGGNAETLAQITHWDGAYRTQAIDLFSLHENLREIASESVSERMNAFHVRKDRAEVMGIAAVIVAALGKWLGVGHFLVPGVGVREGVLHDLARRHFRA